LTTVSAILTVINGFPPNRFATFQHETSWKTLKSLPSNKQSETCELLNQSRKLWLSKKYWCRVGRRVCECARSGMSSVYVCDVWCGVRV
jgi:hypothetical protein